MKHSTQQVGSFFFFCRRALLLLLVFFMALNLHSQHLYYQKGTEITIRGNTTLYIVDSGIVNQERLKDFEEENTAQVQSLNDAKQIAFDDKKIKTLSRKIKKKSASKSVKVKTDNYQAVEPVKFVKICPDNFFSPNSKGIATSGYIPLQYNLKFLVENILFRPVHKYSAGTNNKIFNNGFLLFKESYFSLYTTRPPPFEFYCKEKYTTI
ncbi:hypothetical protein [Chryseobacterium aureum]|uniref:hypothetical protein n=1 Tax=Chryseobacterium aureum TaxID=2497456 RepID=UPI000F85C1E3|nr:hypothetical protein [Chryseobacterium aureum]